MTQIILINGKKRSGKDFFGSELQKRLTAIGKTSEIMSFAEPLKDIMSITLGIQHDKLEKMKNDEADLGYPTNGCGYLTINNCRVILQKFGTEGMKKYFGDAVWVNLLSKRAGDSESDYVIVPDFRFKIEAISFLTVKIKNDDVESTDTHASETELDDFEFFYEIDNTGYKSLESQISMFIMNGLGL